jgi:hypothetical protein
MMPSTTKHSVRVIEDAGQIRKLNRAGVSKAEIARRLELSSPVRNGRNSAGFVVEPFGGVGETLRAHLFHSVLLHDLAETLVKSGVWIEVTDENHQCPCKRGRSSLKLSK